MAEIGALLERCREGDDLAWEALVRRFQGRVYALALQYLRDPEDARDTAQEIFIRLYERLDSFSGGSEFLPWLIRVARNACIDRLRRRGARPPAAAEGPGDTVELMAARDASPEAEAIAGSRRGLLMRAIGCLTENHRELILLHEIHGLKLDEVASMLALPLGTVKSRSNRARLELAAEVRRLDTGYGT